MAIPNIPERLRRMPLSYDPQRKKFIHFDEIVSGKERIVPLRTLARADLKRLIIERARHDPTPVQQSISGPPLSREQVVAAIENDEPFGRAKVEAEASYLDELLEQIREGLASR
jgi:hypothetical protein